MGLIDSSYKALNGADIIIVLTTLNEVALLMLHSVRDINVEKALNK